MGNFQIYPVQLTQGIVAISPMPGRAGSFSSDMVTLLEWQPTLVLTMTTMAELNRAGATDLGDVLQQAGVAWRHLPVEDFGVPANQTLNAWPKAAELAHQILTNNGRVLAHCWGGNGRSGMAALRLILESGMEPSKALPRLRAIRPKAVETDAQKAWAFDFHPQATCCHRT